MPLTSKPVKNSASRNKAPLQNSRNSNPSHKKQTIKFSPKLS